MVVYKKACNLNMGVVVQKEACMHAGGTGAEVRNAKKTAAVTFCRADEVIFFLGYPEDYDTGKFDVPEISKRVKGYTPNSEGVKAGFDAVGGRMTFAVGHCFLLPWGCCSPLLCA
jgi:hypothetical protein